MKSSSTTCVPPVLASSSSKMAISWLPSQSPSPVRTCMPLWARAAHLRACLPPPRSGASARRASAGVASATAASHDARVRKLARDPFEDVDAAPPRHLVVEDDHVRHEFLAGADGLLRITRDADAVHVTLGVDEVAEVLADRRVIVHDEDADPSPKHFRQFRSSGLVHAMSI